MQDASGTGRRLVLVRHGESSWNALGIVQGQADAPGLTDRGRDQAVALALELEGRPVVTLLSSDLTRARQTAEIIAEHLGAPVVLDERVRERKLGVLEGGPVSELAGAGVRTGGVVDADVRPTGGESVRDLYDRVARFVDELTDGPDGDVVVVCHGGPIRVATAYLGGVAPDAMEWWAVDNTQIATFEMAGRDRQTAAVELGPVTHLEGVRR
jgi:2,3-bisphosphoglycerate-dependent phosphoglycerate mutase